MPRRCSFRGEKVASEEANLSRPLAGGRRVGGTMLPCWQDAGRWTTVPCRTAERVKLYPRRRELRTCSCMVCESAKPKAVRLLRLESYFRDDFQFGCPI